MSELNMAALEVLKPPQNGAILHRPSDDRNREAVRLKAVGLSLSEITDRLNYRTEREAVDGIKLALGEMATFARDELRLMELRSLDELEWVAWKTLQNQHVVVSQGRVVRADDGSAYEDDRFILEVVDRIIKIKDRRAKLWGLDAPVRSEVITMSNIEDEITKLEAELARNRNGAGN